MRLNFFKIINYLEHECDRVSSLSGPIYSLFHNILVTEIVGKVNILPTKILICDNKLIV
jgi:hypothetical protein